VLTVAAFLPIAQADFVSLDDPLYVTRNPHVTGGLTLDGVAWAFTASRAANWHPLTWMSHMLDVELFGLQAGGHHAVNLALHITTTLLLFGLLRRLTSATWRSAFVAALFGVHPLHVESVAWIAERKDVLSGLLCVLTLWAYVGYVKARSWPRYATVAGVFVLGLLAKPMLVTLPALMLLLDWWPLGRFAKEAPHRLVVEKLPLFALAAASSWVTVLVQREGGALSGLAAYSIGARAANAVLAYGAYIRDMAWPTGLAVFYPFPRSIDAAAVAGVALALALVTALAFWFAKRAPWLIVGWLWFLGMLVPVIGLVPLGLHGRADRYTYLPLTGLFIVIAWGIGAWRDRAGSRLRLALPAVCVAVIVACGVAARAQVAYWRDATTLWQRASDVVPDNYRAHLSLGMLLVAEGRSSEAFDDLQKAVRIEPDLTEAHRQLANILLAGGRVREAVPHLADLVRLQPASAAAHSDFGQSLASVGRIDEAIAQYRDALRLDPALPEAHNNLGSALAGDGRFAEALPFLVEAVRLEPDFEQAHVNLALLYARLGRHDDAIRECGEVLRINPANAGARQALEELRQRGRRRGGL